MLVISLYRASWKTFFSGVLDHVKQVCCEWSVDVMKLCNRQDEHNLPNLLYEVKVLDIVWAALLNNMGLKANGILTNALVASPVFIFIEGMQHSKK